MNFTIAHGAYPASALSILNDASGANLYDLMIQMRHPESKASAKKEFITAINSVRPGLYQELRRLEYTKPDFTAGYSLVQDIIEANDR